MEQCLSVGKHPNATVPAVRRAIPPPGVPVNRWTSPARGAGSRVVGEGVGRRAQEVEQLTAPLGGQGRVDGREPVGEVAVGGRDELVAARREFDQPPAPVGRVSTASHVSRGLELVEQLGGRRGADTQVARDLAGRAGAVEVELPERAEPGRVQPPGPADRVAVALAGQDQVPYRARGARRRARMHTVTAWTGPEAAESAVARSPAHREAVTRVRRDGLLPRGFTSIWVPHRLNQQQSDCPACGAKVWFDPGTAPRCGCGSEVTVGSYL